MFNITVAAKQEVEMEDGEVKKLLEERCCLKGLQLGKHAKAEDVNGISYRHPKLCEQFKCKHLVGLGLEIHFTFTLSSLIFSVSSPNQIYVEARALSHRHKITSQKGPRHLNAYNLIG